MLFPAMLISDVSSRHQTSGVVLTLAPLPGSIHINVEVGQE